MNIARSARIATAQAAVTAVLAGLLLAVPVAQASSPASTRAAAGSHAGPCTAVDVSAVTVVIDYQDLGGSSVVRCATGLRAGATGADALTAAGVVVTGVGSATDFVCRLQGRPSATEVVPIPGEPTRREGCAATPPAAAYWSYWSAGAGDGWTLSTLGYRAHRVQIGGFEGWSFSHNRTASTNPPPRTAPVSGIVTGQGTVSGTRYRGGLPAAGGISYGVGLQVYRDGTGTTKVRAIGRITKLSKAAAVQIDTVALGAGTSWVLSRTTPVNSGAGATALSSTVWAAVPTGCASYRTRANFSIRWSDTTVSRFSILSPLSRLCRTG